MYIYIHLNVIVTELNPTCFVIQDRPFFLKYSYTEMPGDEMVHRMGSLHGPQGSQKGSTS